MRELQTSGLTSSLSDEPPLQLSTRLSLLASASNHPVLDILMLALATVDTSIGLRQSTFFAVLQNPVSDSALAGAWSLDQLSTKKGWKALGSGRYALILDYQTSIPIG